MELAFELSGEHPSLPRAEVLAVLKSLEIKYRELSFQDFFLIVECGDDAISFLPAIQSRLALTHSIQRVIGRCESDKSEIINLISRVPLPEGGTFCLRVKQKKKVFRKAEEVLGGIIKKRGYGVDLTDPEIFLRMLVWDECIFSEEIAKVDRSSYEHRRPLSRPFFLPGVILPRIARALVNLTQVFPEEVLLDPFCGTGGILIEAGLIGARLVGVDIQKRMVEGSRKNLSFYNLDADLILGDAKRLPISDCSVDAVVADPPYGRSAKVGSPSRDKLYEGSMEEILRVLRKNSLAVVIFPEKYAFPTGFEVEGHHILRVHKSLDRHIIIGRKK
jgi:tRNA (guanine10-N2)-dimethyltransferase